MKKRNMMLAIGLGIAFIFAMALWHSPEAQMPPMGEGGGPGGPPGEGGMMGNFRAQMAITQALPLDSSWVVLSFDMDLSDEALVKARMLYQDAWNQRKEKILDKMEAARGDSEAMKALSSDAEKIWSTLRTKLNEILTPEQIEKFDKWEKESKNQQRMPQGGNRQGGNRPGR